MVSAWRGPKSREFFSNEKKTFPTFAFDLRIFTSGRDFVRVISCFLDGNQPQHTLFKFKRLFVTGKISTLESLFTQRNTQSKQFLGYQHYHSVV